MIFTKTLQVNLEEMQAALGYGASQPDEVTRQGIAAAAGELQAAAQPRWCWGLLPVSFAAESPRQAACITLGAGAIPLQGTDIAAHLAGCSHCVVLALTLGTAADALIRTAEAMDMAHAVLLDTAASTLVEQYADLAEELICTELAAHAEEGMPLYTTSRYSPGYGDLPLTLQGPLLAVVNAQRAIGLTASSSNILVPRKSITALIGVANRPVTGHLAGCSHCVLWNKCRGTARCATRKP